MNNLKYPEEAQQRGEVVLVIIRFLVNKDGSLEDFEINQETTVTSQKQCLMWLENQIGGYTSLTRPWIFESFLDCDCRGVGWKSL